MADYLRFIVAAADLQHRADLVHAMSSNAGLLWIAQAIRQIRQNTEQGDAV